MKTTDLDRVFSSAPTNAPAARVTGKGIHYEPNVSQGQRDTFDVPPKIVNLDNKSDAARSVASELIGLRRGRITVIGLAADHNKKKRSRWVVRCDCGKYEYRKAKALRNSEGNERGFMCTVCEHGEKQKWKYENMGPRPLREFLP